MKIPIEFRYKMGIYKIISKIDYKIYIGSSINIYNRLKSHLYALRKNIHVNLHLQNAFNLYGETNYVIEVIEFVDDKSILLSIEQKYLDEFTPYNHKIGYNICSIAGNSLGRKFSDETKNKMSEAAKGKRMGKKNGMYGKTRLDLSNRNIKNKGKKLSNDMIKKLRTVHKSKNIEQYNNDGILIETFISINEAGRKTNTNVSGICLCCQGKRKSAGGFIWKYS